MNSKIFKQHQGPWAKKPYPTKGCTVAGAGCGLVACTHIAIEQERYKNWTPEDLRPYMVKKGFAVAGQGTRWEGITKTLEHLGHKNVVRIYNDPMSEAWKELNKGNRIGIILFDSSYAPNGIRWTSVGHYVAFTNYKVKNGKHLFYCKDSGGRDHDGWYSYENSMRNCVSKMWIVERVGAQVKSPTATSYRPKTEYKGKLPKGTVKKGKEGDDVKALQTFLNWCIGAGLTVDGVAGDKTIFAIKVFQKTYKLVVDGIFGKASRTKAKSIVKAHKVTKSTPSVKKTDPLQPWFDALKVQYEWSKNQIYKWVSPTVKSSKKKGTCITLPSVALQRLKMLPSGGYVYFNPNTNKISDNPSGWFKKHSDWFEVFYPNKTVAELWKAGKIKKGDIVGFDNPNYHTMVFKGFRNGKPIWDTMGGGKRGLNVEYPYYAKRKISMIVRIKKVR